MNTTSAPLEKAHVPLLDGLRGLAILLVLFYHQTILVSAAPMDEWLARISAVGWIGVDLFFVLSGFLITGILYDAKGSANYFRNFYARRVLRIFPLYYAVVIFSLVVLPQLGHYKAANFGRIAGDEIWYWVFLSNVSIAAAGQFRHAILDISWSLAIEEQFYLIWPLVVLFFSRSALLKICLGCIAFSLGLRIVLVLTGVSPIAVYVLTPCRLDGLAVGALLALSVRGTANAPAWTRHAPKIFLASGALLLALALWQGGLAWDNRWVQTLGYTLLAIFFGALLAQILVTAPQTRLARVFGSSVLIAFGIYSYALYLFHMPVRGVLRDFVFNRFPFFVFGSLVVWQILFYVVATGLTLALAFLSWQLYEKHFLALKRYFPTRAPRDILPREVETKPLVQ